MGFNLHLPRNNLGDSLGHEDVAVAKIITDNHCADPHNQIS